MKIIVDYDLCQGHGMCEAEAPEVFKLNDDGTLTVLNESPDPSLSKKIDNAVKYCPTMAISVEG